MKTNSDDVKNSEKTAVGQTPKKSTRRRTLTPGTMTVDRRPWDLKRIRNKLTLYSVEALDKRSTASLMIRKWQRAIIAELGGPGGISAQQATLLDVASRTKLILDHLDGFLVTQASLIDTRKKKAIPLVVERTKLADSLSRQLAQLGMDRKQTVIPALSSYIETTYTQDA